MTEAQSQNNPAIGTLPNERGEPAGVRSVRRGAIHHRKQRSRERDAEEDRREDALFLCVEGRNPLFFSTERIH